MLGGRRGARDHGNDVRKGNCGYSRRCKKMLLVFFIKKRVFLCLFKNKFKVFKVF